MNILELDKIEYRYDDAVDNEFVLKNISYKFELGKIYAIKGKSGSGKTTLLSLIVDLKNVMKEILFMMVIILKI